MNAPPIVQPTCSPRSGPTCACARAARALVPARVGRAGTARPLLASSAAGSRLVDLDEAEALGAAGRRLRRLRLRREARADRAAARTRAAACPESRFVVADTLVRFDHVARHRRGALRRPGEIAALLDGPLPPVAARQRRRAGTLRRFPTGRARARASSARRSTSARATRSRSSSRSAPSGRRPRPRSSSTARCAASTRRRTSSCSSSTASRSSAPRPRRSSSARAAARR